MSLIPRNSLLDSWFDQGFPSFRLLPETRAEQGILAVDIRETAIGFMLKADFPGLKKDEISVTIDNNILTLSAEHKEEKEEKEKGRIIRQERRYGRYTRSFNLGSGIDEGNIKAKFEDGVLTLDIPKTGVHEPKTRSIEIR